jgi:hypothetical protein
MPDKTSRDKVIQQVVGTLQKEGAHLWSVQDKGVLLGAIKLQLQEGAKGGPETGTLRE